MPAAQKTQETPTRNTASDATSPTHTNQIDRSAPAGSKNSLGAESVRDGRPSTDDSIVEAMDEEGPGPSAPLDNPKSSS
jgi:hypothetical protein